jgi:hypothetical protein
MARDPEFQEWGRILMVVIEEKQVVSVECRRGSSASSKDERGKSLLIRYHDMTARRRL